MPQTLTFAKVFTAEGEKNGKTWKRWDFKTEEGERYVTFNAGLANRISVNTPYTLEIEGDNKIASIIGSAPAPAAGPQPQADLAGTSGWSKDDQIHAQCATKVAAELLRYFDKEEQGLTAFWALTETLKGYYDTGDSVPF